MSTSAQGQTDIKHSCPECGSTHIVIDNKVGERVCSKCGYVLGDIFMDRTPEWRAFNAQERDDRSRVGLPTSLAVSDKGLHTTFGNIYRDTKGKVTTERKWQLLRLSKWQRRVSGDSNQRNLNKAMSILARLVSHLNISRQVQEQAALIYRKALQKELVKGRSIENVMSASLYAACRMTKTQRTLREIAEYKPETIKQVEDELPQILDEIREEAGDEPEEAAQVFKEKVNEALGIRLVVNVFLPEGGEVFAVEAEGTLAPDGDDVAFVEFQAHGASDRSLRAVNKCVNRFFERGEPESVVE